MLLCMTGACGDFKTLARFTAAFGDLHDATAVRGRAVSNRTRDHQRPFHGESRSRRLLDGDRQPQLPPHAKPSPWPHGWQYHASPRLRTQHGEVVVLPRLAWASRAWVRFQSRAYKWEFLVALPIDDLTLAPPERYNYFLRRRARISLTTGR